MAHFRGEVMAGLNGKGASRLSGKRTGLHTTAASVEGAVQTYLWWDEKKNVTMAHVELIPWMGNGVRKTIYRGPVEGDAAMNEKGAES